MLSELATGCGAPTDARSLLDDNLPMVISDVLQAYSPFAEGARDHPDEWYVVGVMMYALGETSRKRLPVDLVSLGTLVKRVRERGGEVTRADILAIADLFSLELFKRDNGDKERIADVLHDYIAVVYGGPARGDR